MDKRIVEMVKKANATAASLDGERTPGREFRLDVTPDMKDAFDRDIAKLRAQFFGSQKTPG